MEKETFKITLADGTSIEGLTQNGNNFISETEIDETIFEDNAPRCQSKVPEEM